MERAGHRLRRRRLHRPLCLRSSVQERRPRPRRRARSAQRLFPPAARRRSASSASSRPTSPTPDSVAPRGRGRRARSSTWSACSSGDMRRGPRRGRAQRRRGRARGRRRRPSSTSPRSAPIPISPSDYGRTKGEGEQAVRAAFPGATIIRPSLVFGPEDELTNRFAAMARLAGPAGDRRRDAASSRSMSATSRRRSRGRARARSATAARPTRSAGRRC